MTRHNLCAFTLAAMASLILVACAHHAVKPAPVPAGPAPLPTVAAPASATASAAQTAAAPAATTAVPPASTAVAPAETATVPVMPTRGMSMVQVERQFGVPLEKLPAVPDPGTKLHPPITRWIYPNYVVYFEYNYVVHSVLKAHPFTDSKPDNP